MRKHDELVVAMSLGAIAFALAFVFPQFTEQVVPWYYPVERRWVLEARSNGLAIDFYGRLLLGMAAWCLVVVASLAVTRRMSGVGARTLGLLVGWSLTIGLLVMLHFVWTLAFRTPAPLELPGWYQPR